MAPRAPLLCCELELVWPLPLAWAPLARRLVPPLERLALLRARFALLLRERLALPPLLREERLAPPPLLREERVALPPLLREERVALLPLLWLLLALLRLLAPLLWLPVPLVLRLLALRLLVPLCRALADCLRSLFDPLLLVREAVLDADVERLRLLARFDAPRSLAADISPSCFRLTCSSRCLGRVEQV
jgi:hypothetical protein